MVKTMFKELQTKALIERLGVRQNRAEDSFYATLRIRPWKMGLELQEFLEAANSNCI